MVRYDRERKACVTGVRRRHDAGGPARAPSAPLPVGKEAEHGPVRGRKACVTGVRRLGKASGPKRAPSAPLPVGKEAEHGPVRSRA